MISIIKKKRKGAVSLLLVFVMALSLFISGCNAAEDNVSGDGSEKVDVVRALCDIEKGSKITSDKVEVISVYKEYLPEGTILSSDEVVGKFAAADIYVGEYFIFSKVSNTKEGGSVDNVFADNGDGILNFDDAGYVIVSDYVQPNTFKDVSDDIQKIIDDNPGRTIYFPDGLYTISKPITTSADPAKAVSLNFSNFARIKAGDKWTEGEPLLKLGATDMADGITNDDNHYSVEGGVFDCSDVADGIWIMNAGTVDLRYCAIKSTVIGIWIKADESGNGPVTDIYSCHIVGNNTTASKGILVDTDGNTITNSNPSRIYIGVEITGTRNVLRNIHPLYGYFGDLREETVHAGSISFKDYGECNIYDSCYSDQQAIAFYLGKDAAPIIDGAFIFWYKSTPETPHRAIVCEGQFNATVRSSHADFSHSLLSHEMDGETETTECIFLTVGEDGGNGVIDACHFDSRRVSSKDVYSDYIVNEIIVS